MIDIRSVAVLGAGSGGHAMAADLSLAGVSVNLFEFPEFEENIGPIREEGGIEITGVARNGFAKLTLATTDLKEAIDGVSHIMVVMQSLAHEKLAKNLRSELQRDQAVVIFAGSGGGLLFVKILGDEIRDKKLSIVENITLPYACRVKGPAQVNVSRLIQGNFCGVFPSNRTNEILKPLIQVFPSIKSAENILEVAFYNPNVLLHPVASLFNIGRIEYSEGEFFIYREGFTASIMKIMEAIDREKMAILERLGFNPLSLDEHFIARYGISFEEWLEMMKPLGSKGPLSASDRYITEDVPIGMVFMATMGRELGVKTPTLDSIINICSRINDTDYWKKGRTAESLGLKNLDLDRMNIFLQNGPS
ncbi:MAG: NAD/NADP octopine/nopaline dehydrogenase family protein [Syntrophobacterales bacterium]|nr:MAG: NAD/NADP octopine/nopaline dehydrogenase family protein [Syntrophobacterales bacterium]